VRRGSKAESVLDTGLGATRTYQRAVRCVIGEGHYRVDCKN
jgi:hypothetical protein